MQYFTLSVLIADDDKEELLTLDRFFRKEGYLTCLANDGYTAVKIVRSRELDLVITDVSMPGFSGIETVREIKLIRPQMPIIVMTGYPSKEIMVSALEEGAYCLLRKPIEINYLRQIVREILPLWP